jgi:hypothetical protein
MKNPFLIIHGLKDTLINLDQAVSLYEASNPRLRKIYFGKEMTHNNFNVKVDILEPIR